MNRDRMIASLEKKLRTSVGGRADLQITDVRRVNKTSANLMIAYTTEPPTNEQITNFLTRQFKGKVTPYISTSQLFREQKVVTVVASLLNITREHKDCEKMKAVIEGFTYYDEDLEETWNVEDRQGKKVLVRKLKDDIMGIINAKKATKFDDQDNRQFTFANLAKASNMLHFIPNLDKGDTVRIFDDGQYREAEIMAVGEKDVKCKCGNETKTIDKSAVVQMIKKSDAAEKGKDKELEDYFADAYGDPKYAKELVK